VQNHSEQNVKLIISYDGADYSGWQIQPGVRTVQGELESALQKIHRKPIILYGAGRTDAGVHAVAQCANFFSTIQTMPPRNFVPALNALLPRDIRVTAAAAVPPQFHARFSATARAYQYRIACGRPLLPHETRYAMSIPFAPSLPLLNSYARLLLGETDCTLFASPSDAIFTRGSGSRFRRIGHAHFFIENGLLVFEIAANAFFRKMVRSIVGTFLHYAQRELPTSAFERILREGKREKAGPTAPPHGLFLWNVFYD
jgi:tRNA pseudouridine38-40 synthase